MSSPPPTATASRLFATAGTSTRHPHPAPFVVAVALALLLVATALFASGAIGRAAHAAVRGHVEAVNDALVRSLRGLDREPTRDDLERLLAERAPDRVRYIGSLRDGVVVAGAGDALGAGVAAGPPIRVGDRVRVVLPPSPHGNVVVYEVESYIANDIFQAGRYLLLVALGAGAVLVVLGAMYSRSLRTREELRARVEADRRLAALGEMSAVLAHELRNPLTSLKGNAQLLGESVAGDGRASKKVDRVVREIVRLENLTNDLLEFVRTGELRLRRVHPREVVDAALENVGQAAVAATYAADLPDLELDPDRLRVALENVVRNAVQASGDAGIEVDVRTEGGQVVITVRDHGRGIASGEEEAIFLPFRTGKAHGTGLGLAIARRIVELHRGTIDASNHEGGGAVFRLRLPISDPSALFR